MNHINYQKKLDEILVKLKKTGEVPTLFLHSCCAPCSSYVLEYLSQYFKITLFYYNPNISPREEYNKRVLEQKRLLDALPTRNKVLFQEGRYDPQRYYREVKGLENEQEGGKRCTVCFRLRLEESARLASEGKFDYFTTTLSISPLKNAKKLAEIAEEMGKKYQVVWLPSDFKKKEGYKRSIQLSREYDLYRQNFCGCIFSREVQDKHEPNSSPCGIE